MSHTSHTFLKQSNLAMNDSPAKTLISITQLIGLTMSLKILSTRRQFLRQMAVAGSVASMGMSLTSCTLVSFLHGVASGDPLHNQVIIWTRVTPVANEKALVHWEVAKDKNFEYPVAHGSTFTDETVDYTVKIDVTGLNPGTQYYYRFHCAASVSQTGLTRTLPHGATEKINFAIFSCSNYPAGFFNVYKEAALRADDIDFALHLGDYLYEYDKDGYASEDAERLDRVVEPSNEILTLADYRQRYAQYRTDLDLQAVHEKLPFIAVWDDHEIANDAWKEGAENHQDDEGLFSERKEQAIQAYYEWMPIREIEPLERERIYRHFEFGDLMSLHMLDTRVIGRDEQLNYTNYFTATGFNAEAFAQDFQNPTRQLLGASQTQWLSENIQSSTATWQVLGQQVLMTSIFIPAPLLFQQISIADFQALVFKAQTAPETLTPEEQSILAAPSLPFNLDAWDGYPVARETVLKTAQVLGKNFISLAGDTHNAWASQLQTLDGNVAGVEFATPSVSSPGLEAVLSDVQPEALAGAFLQFSQELLYTDTQYRGFMLLSVTHEAVTCEWIFVDTIKSLHYQVLESAGKKLKVLANNNHNLLTV